jgi:hypothetical protein
MKAYMTVDEVVAFYSGNELRMRVGALLLLLSAPFFILWASSFANFLRRIGGVDSLGWIIQIGVAGVCAVILWLPGLLLATIVYRPDRDPQTLVLMNDLLWLSITGLWQCFIAIAIGFGFTVLTDRSPKPLFPRWIAYTNFLVMLAYFPAGGVHFVLSGAFAWHGFFGFWVPTIAYGFQFTADTMVILSAIDVVYKEKEKALTL